MVDSLKLPLMFCVVFIHIRPSVEYFTTDWYITRFFCEFLGRIGVPMFLVLSGMLYFGNTEIFTKIEYLQKTRRRLMSLLIPYSIWNLITYFYTCLRSASFIQFDPISVFWGEPNADCMIYPMCGQLWFIRDLFLATLFSPLIYYVVIKSNKYVLWIMVCALLTIHVDNHLRGFTMAFIYFLIGGIIALKKIDLFELCSKKNSVYIVLLFLLSFGNFYFYRINVLFIGTLLELCRLPLFILLFKSFVNQINIKSFRLKLSSFSMFVFCTHVMLKSAGYTMARTLVGTCDSFVGFAITFVGTVIVSLGIYLMLSLCVPSLLKISLGGRI